MAGPNISQTPLSSFRKRGQFSLQSTYCRLPNSVTGPHDQGNPRFLLASSPVQPHCVHDWVIPARMASCQECTLQPAFSVQPTYS